MTSNWISPYKFFANTILESQFASNNDIDAKEALATISEGIGMSVTHSSNFATNPDDENEQVCSMILEVSAKTFKEGFEDEESDNDSPWVYDIRVRASGSVSIHADLKNEDEAAHFERDMKANAISNIYGRIRLHIEQLTASSRYGTFSLPAIAPYELLELEEEEKTSDPML